MSAPEHRYSMSSEVAWKRTSMCRRPITPAPITTMRSGFTRELPWRGAWAGKYRNGIVVTTVRPIVQHMRSKRGLQLLYRGCVRCLRRTRDLLRGERIMNICYEEYDGSLSLLIFKSSSDISERGTNLYCFSSMIFNFRMSFSSRTASSNTATLFSAMN